MRLWLSKSSEVPLREQLVAQIMLGIVSGDLTPGQKLPSTRELGRRFGVHANTVSAAYRDLHRRGWVKFRKGAGIYVCQPGSEWLNGETELDSLVSVFLKAAHGRGFSLDEIQSRVKYWLELQPPDHVLVLEPDCELRRILVAEIEEATGTRVRGLSLEDCNPQALIGAKPVALYNRAKAVRDRLPPGVDCFLLHSTSVPQSLVGEKSPPADALIVVASHWPDFLKWSRAILIAAGVCADALEFRDARVRGWKRGLDTCAFAITDSLTARLLPGFVEVRLVSLIRASSLDALVSDLQKASPVL
ncbi:MAG: GntR family transcriptional regulator [Pyrinomonadaceae bacterium]